MRFPPLVLMSPVKSHDCHQDIQTEINAELAIAMVDSGLFPSVFKSIVRMSPGNRREYSAREKAGSFP
jgi:hypothetical protein